MTNTSTAQPGTTPLSSGSNWLGGELQCSSIRGLSKIVGLGIGVTKKNIVGLKTSDPKAYNKVQDKM